MDLIEYVPDLLNEIEKVEQQRIYILTGERGLGKHRKLHETENQLRESYQDSINIVSIHPDELSFSLWPIESALRIANPNINIVNATSDNGLNYSEQLMSCFVNLCNNHKRTIIFLYRLHMFNKDLWAFTSRLFRLLLDPYRSFNVCFCCCVHTDEGFQLKLAESLRSTQQIVDTFSLFSRNTTYLYFKPWPRNALSEFLEQDLFQGKLRIAPGQEELLIDAVMGNPATLINLVERLKMHNILYLINDLYYCSDFDNAVLLSLGPVIAKEQYQGLDASLQELLRGSSVIGIEFESNLLSNPLEFHQVEDKLKRIISICRIVQQKVDNIYEFESAFSQLSIRDFVSKDELVLWNSKLGKYFCNLSSRQSTEGLYSLSLNSLGKSAFYFYEAGNHPMAMNLYNRIVIQLMAIMQYDDAIKVLNRIRTMHKDMPDLCDNKYILRTWLLEGDCYRHRSDFVNAISAYEEYMKNAHLTKYEMYDVRCKYCLVLYESGEIDRPQKLLNELLQELEKENNSELASILVQTLSCLSSLEETLCDTKLEYHFNAALTIAKKHNLTSEYYGLLRRALIVYKGIYGISLMESAREYFDSIGNQKELAKVLNNISVEMLLNGDLEQARAYYQHSAELLNSFGSEITYVPINGLGAYWCLRGDFERALSLFESIYNDELEEFSRIAILLNQATAFRKLGRFKEAEERLICAENISKEGDASDYSILLPHLIIDRGLLLYDKGAVDEAYDILIKYIDEESSFGRRRTALAAKYIQKICLQLGKPVPDRIKSLSKSTSPSDKRLLHYGIMLVRLSITD